MVCTYINHEIICKEIVRKWQSLLGPLYIGWLTQVIDKILRFM